MILEITAITFLATAMICLAIAYAFLPAGGTIGQRLGQLWKPATPAQEILGESKIEKVEQVLSDIGNILPASKKDLSRAQRQMVRAGLRRPELISVMQGFKVLLPPLLLAIVFFTGVYQYSPIPIFLFTALIGYALPEFWLSRRVRRRQHRILLGLSDALDLLVICVEAGLGIDQAIFRVAQELRISHPALSEELQLINLEMRVGKSRVEALRSVATRTGVEEMKSLTAMLIQTDRFGTDLAQALRVHSDSLRTKRRQRAEEMAAKTTVKLLPPLVFFVFPALFAVLLGPAVITLVHQLLPQLAGKQ